jgi:hypothetical protein
MGTRRKPLSRTQNHFLPVLNSLPDDILFQWILREVEFNDLEAFAKSHLETELDRRLAEISF